MEYCAALKQLYQYDHLLLLWWKIERASEREQWPVSSQPQIITDRAIEREERMREKNTIKNQNNR